MKSIAPKNAKLGEAGFARTLDPFTGTISQWSGCTAILWFTGGTLVFESQIGKIPGQKPIRFAASCGF